MKSISRDFKIAGIIKVKCVFPILDIHGFKNDGALGNVSL